MKEANMQTLFGTHIKRYPPIRTEVYELKICKTHALPFNAVKDHQIEALVQAETDSLYHKITDQPWIKDRPHSYTLKKPFDCFVLVSVKSYVVIWYYQPKRPKIFIKIPIKVYLEEMKTSARKSLTYERAYLLGEPILIH